MNPSTNKYSLLRLCLGTRWVLVFAGDGQVLALVTSQSSGECASIEVVLAVSIFFYFGQIFLQVRVSIRETVTVIALVVIVVEFRCKGKGIVVSCEAIHFFFVAVLKVIYFLAWSVPADILLLLTFGWKSVDLHSIIIKTVGLS